jgi:hypothetical protein
MAIGRKYLEVFSEVPIDGGGLGRGFYDQQFDAGVLSREVIFY